MQRRILVNLLILLFSVSAFAAEPLTNNASMTIDETIAIFGSFSKLDNECMRQIWNDLPPRDVPADQMVAHLVELHLQDYGPGLIILDSGHAHSVAAAVRLAELGYAVEFKMEHDSDFSTTEQAAAAMKALAQRLAVAKRSPGYGRRGRVIALDAHHKRDFAKSEFPTPAEIKSQFHGRVIFVTEAPERDLGDEVSTHAFASRAELVTWLQHYSFSWGWSNAWILQYFEDPQIQVVQHFASPYYNHTLQAYVNVPRGLQGPACEKWVGWGLL